MKNFIIGTAGHIDHGKTSLIRALTGRETDRLEEEKRRGITIDLGFTYFALNNEEQAGIIDVPGHEKFIKNMLAGVGGMDMVLMVIAADEGIMPQTREHLDILTILNMKQGIVVLTKTDMVEEDWLEMVKEEIHEEIENTFLKDAPIIPVSSLTGDGIEELKNEITAMAMMAAGKSCETPIRLPIDRVFTIGGFGTVVTGTQIEGVLNVGDEVIVYPFGENAKIRNLQVHGNNVATSYAGQRVAVNLANIKKDALERGCILAEKNSMEETMMLDVKLELLKNTDRELPNRTRVRLYHGTSEVLCRVILLDREVLKAGESCFAQLRLEEKTAARIHDYFVLRFYSPMETIGGGIVLDPNPLKHKRFQLEILDDLSIREHGSSKDLMECILKKHHDSLQTRESLIHLTGNGKSAAEQDLEQLICEKKVVPLGKEYVVHQTTIQFLREKTGQIIRGFHEKFPLKEGISKEELRNKLYPGKSKWADAMLSYFLEEGFIKITEQMIAMADFKIQFSKEQSQMKEQLEKLYLESGYAAPTNGEVARQYKNQQEVLQILQSMWEEGILIKLDLQTFLHQSWYQKARDELELFLEKNGTITIAEFRDLIETSRKYALLILEYFDNNKITKKVEDARMLFTL